MSFHFLQVKTGIDLRRVLALSLMILIIAAYSALPQFFANADDVPPVDQQTVSEPPSDDTTAASDQNNDQNTNTDTQDGANGTTDGDTVIETGDAVAGGDVVNEVNTNTLTGETATSTAAEIPDTADANTSDENSTEDTNIENSTAGDTASTTAESLVDTDEGNNENSQQECIIPEGNDTTSTTPDTLTDTQTGTSTPESVTENEPVLCDAGDQNALLLDEGAGSEDATTTIENTNNAEVENEVAVGANSGINEATGGGGSVIIDTGNAVATANVVNIVNSNFVGAEGFFQILSSLGNLFGDVEFQFGEVPNCHALLCGVSNLNIQNTNNATTTNAVSVHASTGGNNAANSNGNAVVATGNAYASANVVNFVNTNVVSENYLSFILNAFGSWTGDLVLPPAFSFEDGDSGNGSCTNCLSTVDIENDSNATIESNVGVAANSGGNSAGGGGEDGSVIQTGDAVANANVMTVANTNIFGANSLFVLVRTFGQWKGTIFSLPPGVSVIDTGNGFLIDGLGVFGNGTSTPGNGLNLNVHNQNTAVIGNSVNVSADTGGNSALASGEGGAGIFTGHAYASANVINVANTNVIGKNWLFAIVNVFGDWEGNIAFGRPDLWIGESAELSQDPLEPGSVVTYTFTYRNNGNTSATDVFITDEFSDKLSIIDNGIGNLLEGRRMQWNIGTVNPGEYGTVSYTSQVNQNGVPLGGSDLTNTVTIEGYEDDAFPADNSDTVTLALYGGSEPPAGSGIWYYPQFIIGKEIVGESSAAQGNMVDYKITLYNEGIGSSHDTVVTDVMTDPDGNIVSNQSWNLGEVLSREEIVLEYSVEIAKNAPVGIYNNKAQAVGYTTVAGLPKAWYSRYAEQGLEVTATEKGPDALPAVFNETATTIAAEIEADTNEKIENAETVAAAINENPTAPIVYAGTGEFDTNDDGLIDEYADHLAVADAASYADELDARNSNFAMVAASVLFSWNWLIALLLLMLLVAFYRLSRGGASM